jgi:hypothetical protein
MLDHSYFGELAFVAIVLLPALVFLVFAWFEWIANSLVVRGWRIKAFRSGLVAASGSTAWFFATCVHLLRAGEPAQGFWLFFNRIGILLWLVGLAAALAGKGAGRILLLSSGIMLFLGVFVIDSATIP